MRVELRLASGAVHSGALTLTNDSAAKARIRAEPLDFFIDATETPQFNRSWPQEEEFSCRRWLSLNPMETELEAGASILVRYTLRVPAEAGQRGYHCAAGFVTQPTSEQVTANGLRAAVRIVTAFYIIVGSPPIEGGLKEIKLESSPNPSEFRWQAVVVLHNPGWRHYRPVGELAVLDAQGGTIESVRFRSIPVLPKREQRFLFPLKSLTDAGEYTLRARVDLGTHELQEGMAKVAARASTP
jgi:hypothetical protein